MAISAWDIILHLLRGSNNGSMLMILRLRGGIWMEVRLICCSIGEFNEKMYDFSCHKFQFFRFEIVLFGDLHS